LPYDVQTDASETGIGTVLQKKDENDTRPVAYMSCKVNASEKTYTVHDRDILAVVGSLKE
jgi:hypothetical protein